MRDKNIDKFGKIHELSLGNCKCHCWGTAVNVLLRKQGLGSRGEINTALRIFLETRPVFHVASHVRLLETSFWREKLA